MKINGLIHVQRGCAKAYTPDALSMNDVRSLIVSGVMYAYLTNDNGDNYAINFSKFFSSNPSVAAATTWDDVIAVAEIFATDYIDNNIPVPTHVQVSDTIMELSEVGAGMKIIGDHYINIVAATNHNYIDVGYGSIVKKHLNNKYAARRVTNDVTFTFNRVGVVDINNTVPICNGYFCYPEVDGNVLYGLNGAQLSRNRSDRDGGHILVDFSPAGSIELVKLSDCTGTIDSFKLPADKSMGGKSVLMIIDGHLFMPGDFKRTTDTTIVFDKNKFTRFMHIDKQQCMYDFRRNTGIIELKETDLMNSPNSFLILINANIGIAQYEPIVRISDNMFKFAGYAGGLALDLTTRTIVDYTRIQYGAGHFIQDFNEFNDEKYIAHRFKEFKADQYSVITLNRQNWAKPLVHDNNYMCNSITYSSRRNLDVFNHSAEHNVILLDFMFK